jgi:hypothetical protein
MLYETAARSAEVLALDVEDLDLATGAPGYGARAARSTSLSGQTGTARVSHSRGRFVRPPLNILTDFPGANSGTDFNQAELTLELVIRCITAARAVGVPVSSPIIQASRMAGAERSPGAKDAGLARRPEMPGPG